MPARHITPEEWIESKRIMDLSFQIGLDMEKEAQTEIPESQADENVDHWSNIWGFFDENNRMLATFVCKDFTIRYDGHDVKMGGIGGVASLAESRRKGNVRAIFAALFQELRDKGVLFSYLYPFSHPYYRQFGYELALTPHDIEFPTDAFKEWNRGFEAELLEKGACFRDLRQVYDAFIHDKNLAVVRSDAHWANQMNRCPHKAKVYTYLLRREDRPIAYVVWGPGKLRDGSGQCLEIRDWAYVGREGLQAALGFLYRFSGTFKQTHLKGVPSDLDMLALLPEPWAQNTRVTGNGMARVLDVPKALEGMCHGAEGAYTIRVQDDFLPENTGVYCVKSGPDGVKVEKKAEGQADLSCSVQTFAQLCLGYLDLQGASYKPDVRIDGNVALLRRVFIKKPLHIADYF